MGLIYAQGGRLGDDAGGVVLPGQFEAEGVYYTGRRPCFIWYRGDLYVVGYYTRPVVMHATDSYGWQLAGIRAPAMRLAVVPGVSAGGSSGPCLAAITFLHKVGDVVLAESNFSNIVDVGDLTGQGRVWSNIDNLTAESRVSHVRGYVSMSGADFRAAWEAPYGITAYVENIRTAQLTYLGDGWSHGIPPATRYAVEWAGRMWYARSEQYPFRLWYSEPGFPQYVNSASFRDTIGREEITGVARGRNELIVLCQRRAYMIRQASTGLSEDFIPERLDSDVGCISHFSIMEIHNKLWFASEDGVWLYDGGFRYLMKEMNPLWKEDWVSNRDELEAGFALHDRVNKVYMYVTRRAARPEFENTDLYPGTVIYCGYYGAFEPSMQGDQPHPEWTLDFRHRFDSAGFYNEDGELVIGSCDGIIRKQDWTDGDDDGDTLQKALIIRTGHQLFFEPGDDWEFGKTLLQTWLYVESEASAWTLYVRGGDEQAWEAMLPDNEYQNWKASIAASSLVETKAVRLINSAVESTRLVSYVPATTHYFEPQGCTGRGFTFEVRSTAPVGLEYRGLGGMWGPGPGSTRGIDRTTEAAVELTEWRAYVGGAWTAWAAFPIALTITGATVQVQVRGVLAYAYGTPLWPITFAFQCSSPVIAESVVVPATPTLTATAGAGATPWNLAVPSTGTMRVTTTDGNNVIDVSDDETFAVVATVSTMTAEWRVDTGGGWSAWAAFPCVIVAPPAAYPFQVRVTLAYPSGGAGWPISVVYTCSMPYAETVVIPASPTLQATAGDAVPWNMLVPSLGTYTLTVVATDAYGKVTSSGVLSITTI